MASAEPLKMTHPLSYTPCPASPELPFGESALLYNLAPALDPERPTVVLSGACNLEVSFQARYGGRLMAALRVVVIDAETGAVFSAPPVEYDSRPLVLGPPAPSQVDPAKPREYRGAYFNVDLGAHLFLPPEERDYRVFLWLDELVTPLGRFTLPAHPSRRVQGPSRERVQVPLVFERLAPEKMPTQAVVEGGRVTVPIPAPLLLHEEQSPPIVVLLQGARGRQFRHFTCAPLVQMRAESANAFSFELEALGLTRSTGETLQVLTLIGDTLSRPLLVPWE
jgi:hypothetical protein